VVDSARLHRAELANGLRVRILEDHRLPSFALGVIVPRGVGIESREQAGLAELTAEVMERGAGERDALQLAEVVDSLGASLSVSAGWDSSSAQVSGLSRDLDPLFDVLADVVLRPRFDAEEVAKVRSERMGRLRHAADDPGTLASWNLARVLYPKHRYGLPSMGTLASVGKLQAAASRAFHHSIFTPRGAIFYAVGDVDPRTLLARVRRAYGDWSGGELPPPAPPPAPPDGRKVVLVDRPDLDQAHIALGHGGISRTAEDRIAVQLLNTVLGSGGFSSRLMSRIRAKEGLTYGIGSYFSMRRSAGPFGVYTFTRVPQVARLLRDTLAELERIVREPPSPEELSQAQSLRLGRFALGLETSRAVMAALLDLEVYGLPADSLDTYRRRVRDATPADAAAAAREHIHPQQLSIVVVGPAEALRSQLEPFGPVEVVQP